jgi:chemotaxis protein MotB
MARRKKQNHEGGHENAERWLLTYADMITLLMAFFIMMYSMSVMNLEKFQAVAFSIRSGFGGVLKGGGKHIMMHPPKTDGKSNRQSEMRRMSQEIEEELKKQIGESKLKGKVQVNQEARGVVISVATDGMMFDRGSADLTPLAHEILPSIAGILAKLPNEIMVEGHTCNLPIRTAVFPSNWELASARACRVVRYLGEHGVAMRRLSAVGYGETHKRVPNDTEAHRAMNRRVDILIVGEQQNVNDKAIVPKTVSKPEREFQKVQPHIPKVWEKTGE